MIIPFQISDYSAFLPFRQICKSSETFFYFIEIPFLKSVPH